HEESRHEESIHTGCRQEPLYETTWRKTKTIANDDLLLPRDMSGESSSPNKDDPQLLEGQKKTTTILSVDTQGFRPSELAVSVAGGEVAVAGLHEERSADGRVRVRREVRRVSSLPPGTRPDRVVSSLGQDGLLRIAADGAP
ncbi:MAG: Hsp20 family protein, partial [bacterium]